MSGSWKTPSSAPLPWVPGLFSASRICHPTCTIPPQNASRKKMKSCPSRNWSAARFFNVRLVCAHPSGWLRERACWRGAIRKNCGNLWKRDGLKEINSRQLKVESKEDENARKKNERRILVRQTTLLLPPL